MTDQIPNSNREAMDEFEEILEKEVAETSCFLPSTKTQYAWDSTSLSWLKTCPRLYQYSMIENWRPKHPGPHLFFGLIFAEVCQGYQKSIFQGITHDDAVFDMVKHAHSRSWDWDSDDKYKNKYTLVEAVITYLDQWQDDPAKTVKLTDGTPAVELSFKFQLDWGPKAGEIACHVCGGTGLTGPHNYDGVCSNCGGQKLEGAPQPYILCGHLDRIVEFNGVLMVMDQKTTKTTLAPRYFDQYHPNNQMTLYTLAAGVIYDQPIKGVIIDGLQVLLESPHRCVRGFTYRTPGELDEWLEDLQHWFSLAEFFAESNYWPKNDTACDKFGGCQFKGVCNKDPSVRKAFLKSNFTQEQQRWNPLISRT